MTTQGNNNSFNNLDSDEFLKGNAFHSRLSLLGREFHENIDKFILDENILGKALNKRYLNKKTIYSSNKFKLNLDELNSESPSVDEFLIEEKRKEILVKGEEDGKEEQETIEEEKIEKKYTKKIGEEELFGEIEKELEDVEKNANKNNKKKENGDNDNILEGNEQNKDENKDENKVENINNQKEMDDFSNNLIQDISDHKQENKEKEQIKNSINDSDSSQKNSIQKESIKNNEDIENIFSMISTEEVEKEEEYKQTKENDKNEKNDEEKEKIKDALKEEYYPIDVIEEAEKYYNLSNESNEDLFPLNTYQINNGLCIDFLQFQTPKITTTLPGEITTIGSDHDNNLYICTNVGKIIKIGKDKEKEKESEILIQSEKYNESITCIDIVDQLIITGDENGNIAIWINNSFNQVLSNINDNNNKIISIKILEAIHGKLIFIYTDIKSNLNFIKIKNLSKNNSNDYIFKEIECDFLPIYKILLIPNNISFIKSKKEKAAIVLVSPQNIGIYGLLLKNHTLKEIKLEEYFHGERGKYFFDASTGFGFPPISELNKEKLGSESANNSRKAISKNVFLENNIEEIQMISISYGKCIKLYEIKISNNDVTDVEEIGFIVNDRPILRNGFITDSMIFLVNDNFDIKLINTYDFVSKKYNSFRDIKATTDFLISYESLNIFNYGLTWDLIHFNIGNRTIQHKIFSNKIIVNNFHILFISNGGNKLQEIALSNYDDVLRSLCNKEEYIIMLWLLSIILNKKTNLLNKQLSIIEKNYKEDKKSLLDLYLLWFLTKKTIPELKNNNEIYARMILEFMIETDTFDSFATSKDYFDLLIIYDVDKYLYTNLTKYIVNGYLNDIVLNDIFLQKYINYYISKNEKLLLNKILLKLNLDTLLQKNILDTILDKELINPYIYTKIKNTNVGRIDYFLPALYLDSLFQKEHLEKKSEELIKQSLSPEQLELYNKQLEQKKELMKEEIEKNLNISKDYKILIREHNMDYFNEKTFTCHEYIGHKFLWYCNKCLSGKEYPNDSLMSDKSHRETAIKILSFLLNKENMKFYLEFDSYTYLKIISQFFIDANLGQYISGGDNYSLLEKEAIKENLGGNTPDDFNLLFVYSSIKESLKDIEVNKYFLKYDFCAMVCLICEKDKEFIFENQDIKDALSYFSELDINDFNDEEDAYNCHRKANGEKEKEKFKNKIEQFMIILLNYLKSHKLLTEEYANNLLKEKNIVQYKKVTFYLYEITQNYEQCLKIKISEFKSKKNLVREKEIKEFFNWIIKIHENIQNSKDSEKCMDEFKKLLLENLNKLCEISTEELPKVIDKFFETVDEKMNIIKELGKGGNTEIQLKYLDECIKIKDDEIKEGIGDNNWLLDMELNILIKTRNKKRIKNLLMKYKVLCNEQILAKLEKHGFNDSCIYICQILKNVKKSIKITINEVGQKYRNIINVLEMPNYNPIIIDIELNEMYRYFELGLNACQFQFLGKEKEEKQIDESWQDLFNAACKMKIDFYPRYEHNRNNVKTQAHKKIFNVIQSCIELILGVMADYITLNLLVDTIAKNCEKWKAIDFYTFIDKSCYSFRRTEQILKCGENLGATSVLIKYDDIQQMKTLGKNICLEDDKCNFCKFSLKSSITNSFCMFFCGHKYHIGCTKIENGEKFCYICKMNELEGDHEKVNELKNADCVQIPVEIDKEEDEELKIKLKEKERRLNNKKKLNALKKLKKKRKEVDLFIRNTDFYD